MRISIIITVLCLLVLSSTVFSQTHTCDFRIGEWNTDGQLTYRNFIYALNVGRLMGTVFHTRLPQLDGYKETVVGIGYDMITIGDIKCYPLLHYSKINGNITCIQPGGFFLDTTGKWTGSFWAVYYLPIGNDFIKQLVIDPIEYQYNIWESLSVGLSATMVFPKVGDYEIKAGPKVALGDKHGTSELRFAKSNLGGWQLQVRRQLFF